MNILSIKSLICSNESSGSVPVRQHYTCVKGKTCAELFRSTTGLEYSYTDIFKVSKRVLI